MKIGKYIILKASEMPHYLKAEKLARTLTENDIDLILTGKMHLHGNPRRKLRVVGSDKCQANVQSLAPVEIVTDDGHDFGKELP